MIKQEELDELILKYMVAFQVLQSELNIQIKEYEFKNKYTLIEHIKSRIKTQESAINKLKRKGYDISIDNLKKYIHDMIGIRIVCPFISDVYEIVNIIKKSYIISIIEERNYIKNPKISGYQSYHIIVKVPISLNDKKEYIKAEIQIRTMAMDFWASIDHKIQYKFEKEIPEEIKDEMLDCSYAIQELDNRMQTINENVRKYNNL